MHVPAVRPPRALTSVLLAVVIVTALAARLIPGARTIDDAFITFRYSRNLVEGAGFVYNPGVRTLGTTTPLFTVALAGASALLNGQDFPAYATAASALADAATAALLFLLARRLTGSDGMGLLAGLLWAVSPRSVTFAVGGMETSLAILWLVGAAWWLARGRDRLLGLFAGLGLLTRVDSALWVAPILAYQLVERRRGRPPWATWLVCGLVLLPWLLFSAFYFGSPLPNSLAAKTVAYQMPPAAALGTFITAYATPFFEFDTFGPAGAMIAGPIYLALSLFGLLYAAHHLPRLLPFLAYPWLYLVVFALANPLVFRWYLAPPLPALMLAILAGLWSLARPLLARPRLRPVGVALLAAAGALWLFTSLNAWTPRPDHGPDRPAPAMAWHDIELNYERLGRALRDDYGVTEDTRVASADIGAIGYFSGATIVDTVGLVTPRLSRYYPVPAGIVPPGQNYAIPPALIFDTEPDYLVTMEAFVRLGLERDPRFEAGYRLLREIPTGYYGTGMRLYQRRDIE